MVVDPQYIKSWVEALMPIVSPVLIASIGIMTALGMKWVGTKMNEIHKAVNSQYGISLEIGAVALERVAAITHDPIDAERARGARRLADEHERTQKNVEQREHLGI